MKKAPNFASIGQEQGNEARPYQNKLFVGTDYPNLYLSDTRKLLLMATQIDA